MWYFFEAKCKPGATTGRLYMRFPRWVGRWSTTITGLPYVLFHYVRIGETFYFGYALEPIEPSSIVYHAAYRRPSNLMARVGCRVDSTTIPGLHLLGAVQGEGIVLYEWTDPATQKKRYYLVCATTQEAAKSAQSEGKALRERQIQIWHIMHQTGLPEASVEAIVKLVRISRTKTTIAFAAALLTEWGWDAELACKKAAELKALPPSQLAEAVEKYVPASYTINDRDICLYGLEYTVRLVAHSLSGS